MVAIDTGSHCDIISVKNVVSWEIKIKRRGGVKKSGESRIF
jgi:hypothetical protein